MVSLQDANHSQKNVRFGQSKLKPDQLIMSGQHSDFYSTEKKCNSLLCFSQYVQ